jgi:microsomal epoxide hydrolase
MLYWTTGTITSSMRIYFEQISSVFTGNDSKLLNGPLAKSVPVAIVNYRHEVMYTPRTIAKVKYPNIKLWLCHDEGGHFAAMEKPRQYSSDVENFLIEL